MAQTRDVMPDGTSHAERHVTNWIALERGIDIENICSP